MKNAWEVRNHMKLIDRIAISRATFEEHFTKTKERIEYTFNGWDGKADSYDGATRFGYVYRCNLEGAERFCFIKVGKGVHSIDFGHMVLNKATGKMNPSTDWLVDVLR